MTKVIGVRFREAGKVYYFDPIDMEIKRDDHVIVETARGVEYGTVVLGVSEVEDEKIAEEVRAEARRGPFRFSECKIPFGSEITYVEDESIVATVLDDRHILYNGQTTSLSALARELKQFDHAVQGTLWFKYKGEVLNDIRLKLEKKK